ncbi:hypothetical protein MDAP_002764 [Mitosporidium daphniae]|uniref:Uncharacterized protein n=1 Tax=Mitosporidium daphniae TaxID=1485682 RepID=A0A098VTM3_9MICR|nr:uncharacterized protein DI09_1p340 [Mitosporidium daphniae]KGG52184.1 hypothetical protein DI09_1p340 [Mitosporidium daphniae]|eukprot:XP_013238611.1 uncharacterized protein DI09_1p340 [Mitosporidium daphniae]
MPEPPPQNLDGLPAGMDMNTYSHYYYSTYYPEYYAKLKASASEQSHSLSSLVSASNLQTSPAMGPAPSAAAGPLIGPALGSRVAGEKAFRQMSHYFNYEAYNDAINQDMKDGKRTPLKLTRKEVNVLKQRKMERKKKRMLDWLYND